MKMVQDRAILTIAEQSKSYMVYRTVPYSWRPTTFTHDFKVTPLLDAEYLRNGTRYGHCFNGILIGTYIRPSQQCHFEWPWVILSDLTKYDTIRNTKRLSVTAELLVMKLEVWERTLDLNNWRCRNNVPLSPVQWHYNLPLSFLNPV